MKQNSYQLISLDTYLCLLCQQHFIKTEPTVQKLSCYKQRDRQTDIGKSRRVQAILVP